MIGLKRGHMNYYFGMDLSAYYSLTNTLKLFNCKYSFESFAVVVLGYKMKSCRESCEQIKNQRIIPTRNSTKKCICRMI